MSPLAWIVVLTAVGVAGGVVVAGALLQPAPSLARTIEHLRRPGSTDDGSSAGRVHPATEPLIRAITSRPRLLPDPADLRLTGRTVEQHAAALMASAAAGLLGPPLTLGALQSVGIIGLDRSVPVLIGIVGIVVGPAVLHARTVDDAARIRSDLRYQVSAYLDIVTMLLAGNAGYEGALQQAASAGDGRLFVQLRRRMRESGARGTSLTDALRLTGEEFGLAELEQVASTAALSAAEGAPVARTLAAKCATLRSALAAEHEAEARLRTSRLTTPIVGMALIFMALVMYPALNF